jgi:hypothetical protein
MGSIGWTKEPCWTTSSSMLEAENELFFGLHAVFFPAGISRSGASHIRRLLLRLAVGWRPPYCLPSGACLMLGSSMP